jgi:predicted dehydrogenase
VHDGAKDKIRKIKIGLLGAGNVVREFHLPVLCATAEAEISWLCDKVEERAQKLSRAHLLSADVFTRVEDCPDVDILLLAIPVGLRNGPLQHAFKRGWNVLCEKPFAVSLAEHDRILKQAADSGVQIGVGLLRRYYRTTLLARKLVVSGVLGDIREVWASQGTRLTRTGRSEWYQGDLKAAGGGVLIETGSHLVDQLFAVLDVREFAIRDCAQRVIGGIDFETKAAGCLTTPNQSEISFTLALSNLKDLYSGIDIRFSHGVLKLSVSPENPILCALDGQPLARLQGEDGAELVSQAFYLEWTDFIRQCLDSNRYKSAITADAARQTTAFIDQCYQMARSPSGSPTAEVNA